MAAVRRRIEDKHHRLDATASKSARRFLNHGTSAEPLEHVSEKIIIERKRNRLAREANERFLRSGIEVSDVFGKLAESTGSALHFDPVRSRS